MVEVTVYWYYTPMAKTTLTIATRESPLALWQAEWVKSQLEKLHPTLIVNLLGLTTTADKLLDIPLATVGGKGLFVKELEEALLDGRADIAVHSMKDVPMQFPEGLFLPVICEREDPRDAFVSNAFSSFEDLPKDAVLGTSSVRRQSQLASLRSDIVMENVRGNVNTRLKKLDQGDFTALILAAAGLKRLNLASRIRAYLSFEQCLPAAGQGALGIECRKEDWETQTLIALLNHQETHLTVSAERAVCQRLGGGCQVPLAAYAEVVDQKIFLRALVASQDGQRILRAEHTSSPMNPDNLGFLVAEDLIAQGAEKILYEP